MARRRVAVLVSGRGSNLQALIDGCARPNSAARIALVLANRPGAGGLARAEAAGIAAAVVDHTAFADRPDFEAALNAELARHQIDLICLAGFMRVLSAGFVERWRDRLLNIHPSLLPAFPGLDTHARVLAAGVRFTGCTVHFVRAKIDAGPIIVQAVLPVLPDDDAAGLAARVLAMEHRCYKLALQLVAADKARVLGEVVMVEGATAAGGVLINPGGG